MNKSFILLALASIVIVNKADAQLTATSVDNGNWTSTSTWDCSGVPCVPTAGYDVTIATNVTLDMNFEVLSASNSLTINAGASLVQDATPRAISIISTGSVTSSGDLTVATFSLAVAGGTFTTSGFGASTITTLSNLGTVQNDATMSIAGGSNYGTFTNGKTLNLSIFSNFGTFTNNQNITFTDITNLAGGTFTNANGSSMNGTNFVNLGTLTNNGYINLSINFSSLGGITYNNGSIIPFNDCYTNGSFVNSASGFLAVGNDYVNGDTTNIFNGVMINDGRIEVGNDFVNVDTIQGTGYICVAAGSVNTGWFLGTFDFCDTTILTSGDTVDVNIGLIESGITTCTGTACFTLNPLGIENISNHNSIKIYPNPAGDMLYIEIEKHQTLRFELFNVAGQQVLSINESSGSHFSVDLSSLKGGCYLLKSTDKDGSYTSQIIVKQ